MASTFVLALAFGKLGFPILLGNPAPLTGQLRGGGRGHLTMDSDTEAQFLAAAYAFLSKISLGGGPSIPAQRVESVKSSKLT